MPNNLKIICSALTSVVMAISALADSRPRSAASETLEAASARKVGATYKSSDIIGLDVYNNNGEVLGRAEDLALDLPHGAVVSVVIGVGGFMGVGSDYIAVPPDQVGITYDHKTLLLNSTREKLKTAPTFSSDQWNDFYTSGRWYESARFFTGKEAAKVDPKNIQRATKVIRMTVKNAKDEKIGAVENFMIDLNNKKVVAVVITSGGVLRIGDILNAVPSRLFTEADNNSLQLDTTKEALQQAPHFKQSDWPDFSQPAYVESVYHAFDLSVSSEYDERNTGANSTAHNVRDRDGKNVTPLDQGNGSPDLHISQQIRKAIVENKALSIPAQNVKVITANGHVTLRGPVRTAEEKRIIGDIASGVASKGNVENQLEVKSDAASVTER